MKHCQEVVDGLELENDSEMAQKCEQVSIFPISDRIRLSGQVFRRVMYLEQRFWPDVRGDQQ